MTRSLTFRPWFIYTLWRKQLFADTFVSANHTLICKLVVRRKVPLPKSFVNYYFFKILFLKIKIVEAFDELIEHCLSQLHLLESQHYKPYPLHFYKLRTNLVFPYFLHKNHGIFIIALVKQTHFVDRK